MIFLKHTPSGKEYFYQIDNQELKDVQIRKGNYKPVIGPREERAWRYTCSSFPLLEFGSGWCAIAHTLVNARKLITLKQRPWIMEQPNENK